MSAAFAKDDLLSRAGGDAEILAEVVQVARETWPRMLDDLEGYVAGGDPEKVRKGAHALAGSVANFTDGPALRGARALESWGRRGILSGARDVLKRVHADVAALLADLELVARPQNRQGINRRVRQERKGFGSDWFTPMLQCPSLTGEVAGLEGDRLIWVGHGHERSEPSPALLFPDSPFT